MHCIKVMKVFKDAYNSVIFLFTFLIPIFVCVYIILLQVYCYLGRLLAIVFTLHNYNTCQVSDEKEIQLINMNQTFAIYSSLLQKIPNSFNRARIEH